MQESTNEIITPRIVMRCEALRPIFQPNRPAISEPASGASAIVSRRFSLSVVDISVLPEINL
jgi:hypothetical protein